jgi:hypothetical protein
MTDLTVSASTYGNPIPEVWGDVRVGGNMIWSSSIIEHKHKKKAGIGQYYNQYTYTADFAMAFCRGPAQSLRRIWANGKLIYDATGSSKNVTNGKYKFSFYNGTEDQMPDPTISATIGIDNTPPYRGTVYLVFTGFDLSTSATRFRRSPPKSMLGPQGTTPTTLFNNGDPTVAYPNFYAGTMAVDYVHGYFYTSNKPSTASSSGTWRPARTSAKPSSSCRPKILGTAARCPMSSRSTATATSSST